MKKNFLPLFFVLAATSTVFAKPAINLSTMRFVPHAWQSQNQSDIITIDSKSDSGVTLEIYVSQMLFPGSTDKPSGIIVNNCNGANNIVVNPGSSIVCPLDPGKGPVTFSSNSEKPSSGSYQIQ